jgi:ABC-type transport system involved in cytochrome bd biosynthesis fused ATPase/permease subunit
MIALLLTRWRFGLSIVAALAVLGLVGALSHYRSAYHAEKALRRADKASYTAAQSIAAAKALAALQATESRYRSKADDADKAYQAELADARTAADRYIAAHRVRGQAVAGSSGGTVASASGGGASVPDAVPADSVLVSASDLQACTAVTAYGIAAHNWAVGLKIGQ